MKVRNTAFEPIVFPKWATWGKRKGIQLEAPGPGLCKWCGNACPPRRSSWCSDACKHRFARVWDWAAMVRFIYERDSTATAVNGKIVLIPTCYLCDTQDGGPHGPDRTTGWEVDHIVPLKKGGTDDPENLRLLCHYCHVKVRDEQGLLTR